MRRKNVVFRGLLLALAMLAAAGPPARGEGIPAGWVLDPQALRFVGKDLYGHIDGGAELYFEFGFVSLLVERYRNGEKELIVESYRMESPEAALGIYLATCGDARPVGLIGERNAGGRYQVSAVEGDLFVQVNNPPGDETILPIMVLIAKETLTGARPGGDAAKLLDLLPLEYRVAGSERLIRGPYALQSIFTFGEGDILQLKGRVFGVAASYKMGEETVTWIRVPYPSAESAKAAFAHLVKNLDPYLEIIRSDPDRLLFKDYREKYGEAYPADKILEIRVNLGEPPK
jgi:hypothetical protein